MTLRALPFCTCVALTVAACAEARLSPAPVAPAAASSTAPAAPEAMAPPSPPPPVLQVVPPGNEVHWGGAGHAFTLSGRDCETSIVDVEAGRVTARVDGCQVWPAPARDAFVIAERDRTLSLWDRTGTRRVLMPGGQPHLESVAWSPDGARVALLRPGSVVMVDVDAPDGTPEAVRTVALPDTGGDAFRRGGEVVWRADGSGLVLRDAERLWTMEPSGAASVMLTASCVGGSQLRAAPTGDAVVVQCSNHAEVWDTRAATLRTQAPYVRGWSATGRHLLVLAPAPEVHDAATGALELRPSGSSIGGYAFSPHDTWLASEDSSDQGPAVDVWDLATKKRVLRAAGMAAPQWSADGRFLALRSDDGQRPRLSILAAASWTTVWDRAQNTHATWSPTGSRVALTSPANRLEVFDPSSATSWSVPTASVARFTRLAPMPDGDVAAVMALDDPGDPQQALRIQGDGGASVMDWPSEAMDALPSPDGARTLRTKRTSDVMSVSWRLSLDGPGPADHAFVESGGGPYLAQWSARGDRLLVVGGRAVLYEAGTRRVWKVPLRGGPRFALDAAGEHVATVTADGLQVLSLIAREAPITLGPAPEPPAPWLALAGGRVAAVTARGAVTVWDVAKREVVASWSAGLEPASVEWLGEGSRLVVARGEEARVFRSDGTRGLTLRVVRSGGKATVVSGDVP